MKAQTYCFDIDGTLCSNTDGDYDHAAPFSERIAEVNRLYDLGHTILLQTARGSTTGIDWRGVTERQLRSWGVRYHQLFMGKPTADVYVDDKAINVDDWHTSGRAVYVNGKFVPEGAARVSIYDSALMFGDMVFEMTRSFGGRQFKLRQHLERLYTGLRILRIPLTMTIDEMEAAVYATIERNQSAFAADDEHRVMIDVSRGLLGIYQGVSGLPAGPTVIIADFPLRWTVAGMGHLFDSGINAVIPSQRALPGSLLDPKIKNRNRIHYLMANIEVSACAGTDNWALLLDPDGFIAEGSGDNFFIVKNETIISPEGRNILRGISRAMVMEELAPKLGLSVVERNIEPYDVYAADEAFMTATPFCILPVTRLNGLPIGTGAVGPVFRRLLAAWSDEVGVDIAGQIKQWDAQRRPASSEGEELPTPYQFRSGRR